jgi:hypothetical protein
VTSYTLFYVVVSLLSGQSEMRSIPGIASLAECESMKSFTAARIRVKDAKCVQRHAALASTQPTIQPQE